MNRLADTYVSWKWLIGAAAATLMAVMSTAWAVLDNHEARPHEGSATKQEVMQMEQRIREDVRANRQLLVKILERKRGN